MTQQRQNVDGIGAKLKPDHPFYDLIAQAYTTFDYPVPASTGVCENCCMHPDIEKDFLNHEAPNLPLEYVEDWFDAACDPGGMPRSVWSFLLPRVLEILAAGEDPARVALEVSLSRFPTGDKTCWSAEEWDVLRRFQTRYLKQYAQNSGEYLDDAVCMFANAGWPLDDLFRQILGWDDTLLVTRLWQDWCRWSKQEIWITPFWERDTVSVVQAFYVSGDLQHRMLEFGQRADVVADVSKKALDVAEVIHSHLNWRTNKDGDEIGHQG